jgi:nicotinamidase/pyrazinamidase
MNRLLLIVDPQIDFISGTLPVPGAEAAMEALAAYVGEQGGSYAATVVTCDFHPHDHCSFSGFGGQWPAHCVAHSTGAAVWPSLHAALCASGSPLEMLCKGQDVQTEEYSIFKNAVARERIQAIVAEKDIEQIDVCGIAGDICVLQTLRDGVELFGPARFRVLEQFAPSLDGGASLSDFVRELVTCTR